MKTSICNLTCLFALGLAVWADEKATATVEEAARAVAGQNSYAWTSTAKSAEGTLDLNQGPTHGKSQKDGFSHVTFTLRDSSIELGFHKDRYAIKWADKWRGKSDLIDDVAWIANRLESYKLAADEAAFLATHSPDLSSKNSGEYAGALDDVALRFLLSRGRQEVTDVKEISGSVRFWIEEGQLRKYEHHVQGPVPLGRDGAVATMDRTTVIEIHDIGSTEVKIPAEAMEKLQ